MITAATPLELGRRLLDVPSRDYVSAAADQIRRLLPGDDACWVQCNWDTNSFVFWRNSSSARDAAVERILPGAYANPAVQSYLRGPADLSPRRLSDLRPRTDEEMAALQVAHESIGRQQVSMIVNLPSSTIGEGWIVARDGRDFRDDELDVATWILPVLLVLDRLHQPDLTRTPANLREVLTARELQVIDLLATGLTAVSIGHLLGISHRTVSKHVQNAYGKLGIHDRLLVATSETAESAATLAGTIRTNGAAQAAAPLTGMRAHNRL